MKELQILLTTVSLLPAFIVKGNVKFQLEVNENKDTNFSVSKFEFVLLNSIPADF
jgi:hypothetical protein